MTQPPRSVILWRSYQRSAVPEARPRWGVAGPVLVSLTANAPRAPQTSPPATRQAPSPSPSPTPSPIESPTPSPSPSPTVQPSPVVVPAWAALQGSCVSGPAAQEAVLQLQGTANPVLADVSNAKAPRTLCGISGGAFQPELVTQTMISWYATQGNPSAPGTSVIAVLDLFTSTSTVAATWSGGSFMDGLHAWSPDRGFLAYIASDQGSVTLHLLSAGVSQAFGQQLAWIRPRADAGDDNLAFTVRDSTGSPRVWLYGHGGRSGGQLPNVRSSPAWLNSTTFFDVEETVCSTNCGLGPAWQPDGKTFTYDIAAQAETSSKISQVFGAWPRPGQTCQPDVGWGDHDADRERADHQAR